MQVIVIVISVIESIGFCYFSLDAASQFSVRNCTSCLLRHTTTDWIMEFQWVHFRHFEYDEIMQVLLHFISIKVDDTFCSEIDFSHGI